MSRWLPIELAQDGSEGRLVVVFWLEEDDPRNPERYGFDYLEDGVWQNHQDNYECYCAVAPPGSRGPTEIAPYTHWKRLGSPYDTGDLDAQLSPESLADVQAGRQVCRALFTGLAEVASLESLKPKE